MRVRRLTVQGFRGISQPVTLHFSNSHSGSPASCLLIGENGAGKSSFVDALEFCLSGKFPTNPNRPKWPYLQRLANVNDIARDSRVEVEFADGSTFSRSVVERDGVWAQDPIPPHPMFQGSGFALRREEIINFLRTPPDKRYGVFATFMRNTVATTEVPQENKDAVAKSEADREAQGESRNRVARSLSRKMGVSYHRIEPAVQSLAAFNGWFASNGYVRKQDERGGRKVPREREEVYRLAAAVRREIEQFVIATDRMNRLKNLASKAPLIILLAEVGGNLTESFKRISLRRKPWTR